MKKVIMGLGFVAALLAVVVFTSSTLAAVAIEVQEGNGFNVVPVRGEPFNPDDAAKEDDPRVEQPKTDEPKKETFKVRVDPRNVLVTNALTAIAAAEKAVAEGNKEVATAELAKAKTALEALQKVMVRPAVRSDAKPTGGADNPAGDPNVKSKEEARDELRKNMETRKLGRQPVDVAPNSK